MAWDNLPKVWPMTVLRQGASAAASKLNVAFWASFYYSIFLSLSLCLSKSKFSTSTQWPIKFVLKRPRHFWLDWRVIVISLSWFSYFCFSAYSHCHNINRSCFVLSTLTHVRDICLRQGLFTLTANQIQTSYRIVSRSDWSIMLKTHLNLIPEHILLADRYLWLPTM